MGFTSNLTPKLYPHFTKLFDQAMGKLGYRSSAVDALQGADLTGRVAVVTGANSGIGVETVRALAHAGADCILCSRSVEAGERVAAQLQPGVKGRISARQLDLADLSSVAALADALSSSLPRLDLLVLNAGVMACPLARTKDGFEMQIGTNHFGHFQLTKLLLPKLKETQRVHGTPVRVVAVSSVAHSMGRLDLQDLSYERRKYSPWQSYGQSKLANVLFVAELARRLKEEGSAVQAFSLHPGVIKTPLQRHMGWPAAVMNFLGAPFMKTVSQGAATSVFAATAVDLEGKSGAYLADCAVAQPSKAAQDAQLAAALWDKTEELLAAALQKRGGAQATAAAA